MHVSMVYVMPCMLYVYACMLRKLAFVSRGVGGKIRLVPKLNVIPQTTEALQFALFEHHRTLSFVIATEFIIIN